MTDTFTDEVIETDYEEMYELVLDEVERIGRETREHIAKLNLRIQELENELERTRQNNISMAYNLAGPGR